MAMRNDDGAITGTQPCAIITPPQSKGGRPVNR
jgi:hypothetical protein